MIKHLLSLPTACVVVCALLLVGYVFLTATLQEDERTRIRQRNLAGEINNAQILEAAEEREALEKY